METISKIRNWIKTGQKSIRQVSRETGLSRVTIRKYLEDDHAAPQYRRRKPTRSKRLIEHEASLREMIEADTGRAVRERRSMRGLYEALILEGYEGSYDTVRRFVLRYKPTSKSAAKGYIPLEFDAGDALQFDWSHEIVTLNGVDQKFMLHISN